MGASAVLVSLMRNVAIERRWVDRPDNDRKVHRKPIPTVGGIAIGLGILVGLTLLYSIRSWLPFGLPVPSPAVIIACGAMVIMGFIDDTRSLGFKSKLVVQLIVAYMLIHVGFRFDLSGLSFFANDPYLEATYSSIITMFWIVGIINAINLLDGLDGLAAGVSVIAFVTFSVIMLLAGNVGMVAIAIVVSGSLGGFLIYNSNPASIFMGDSGSLLLGSLLAVFSLESQVHSDAVVSVLIPIVVLGLPILDTNLSIVRRLVSRSGVFSPDRDHIHHRLLIHWSPRAAVYILYAIAASFGLIAVIMTTVSPTIAFGLFAFALLAISVGIYALGYVQARPIHFEPHSLENISAESVRGNDHSVAGGQLDLADQAPIHPESKQDPDQTRSVNKNLEQSVMSGDGAVGEPVPIETHEYTMGSVSESSRVVAVENLALADLGDESVVLDVNSGVYFGLNTVGAFIIERISSPTRVSVLLEAIADNFDARQEVLTKDTLDFLSRMQDANLIKVVDETPA